MESEGEGGAAISKIQKGEWRPPNAGVRLALDVLAVVGLTGWVADTVLDQLGRAGLFVRQDYYVPSRDELYNLYCQVDSASYRRLPFRWVMCAETISELKKLYGGTKYAQMLAFSWDNDPAKVVEPRGVNVFDNMRLFDVPIRIDPAARRPLIELVDE